MGYMVYSVIRVKINLVLWKMELYIKCWDIVVKNILYIRVIKILYIYYCMYVEY